MWLKTNQRTASWRSVQVRLFFICWLIYLLHWSPFVVREHYLTISLAEKASVRVDEYLDLHSDLFELPGRGGFIGSNPGTSILAAVPYWLALPLTNRIAPVRPVVPDQEVSAEYKQKWWNNVLFYRKVRARGLDVRLALAALITSGFFMAPLTALSVAIMFRLLGHIGYSQKFSLGMALLYALGTPVFFRTGILSLNLLVTLLGFFAFVLLWWPSGTRPDWERWRLAGAGLLAGWAVLTDYSGAVAAGLLGLFALARQMKNKSFWPAFKNSLWFLAGATGPVVLLLAYQWYCFGNPWLPVQYHMPKEWYQGYPSERGFGWPLPAALWGLLFHPLYGLLVFAPFLALALYHPVMIWRRKNRVPGQVALFSGIFFVAFWVFFACVHYTLRHQWQEGVRYMVPVVPYLFLLLADVLARTPRVLTYLVASAAILETWCLAMVRESPLDSIAQVVLKGVELPWLTTLIRTAPQYYPPFADGASPLPLLLVACGLVWVIWKVRSPWGPSSTSGSSFTGGQ